LVGLLKENFGKAKAWTEQNRGLAIGAAAAGAFATIATLAAVIPAWKGKKSRNRHGRGKREGRLNERAAVEIDGLDFEDEEQLLQFFAEMIENLDLE
jgi:hypothetical protein